MLRAIRAGAAMLVVVVLIVPAAAQAQPKDEWQFGATIYGYFPDISGRTRFAPAGGGGEFALDIGTILDKLKFAFMGAFEAHNGRWGVLADVIYMDIGESKYGSRDLVVNGGVPAGATANLDFDMKGWVGTLAGTYRAVVRPGYLLDVVAGARVLDIRQKLNWTFTGDLGQIPLPDRAGTREVDGQNWDAIVGVKGRYAFGDGQRWFVPYYLDIGAGQSKFTWQAVGGVGYSFGWGDVLAAWRYTDYEMKSGKALEAMTFSGPAVGALFRW
ncbi:MAG: hypothetical protein IPM30_11275 [Burkholderiales bacterium]|nr:hypothetical protein [Burkholderiales bacterium]